MSKMAAVFDVKDETEESIDTSVLDHVGPNSVVPVTENAGVIPDSRGPPKRRYKLRFSAEGCWGL